MNRTTRIDIADQTIAALGIQAWFEVEPVTSDIPGGSCDQTWATAYVQAPGRQRQYVGEAMTIEGFDRLRARALASANDIAEELAPPPPPAAPAAKAPKKTRKAAVVAPHVIITNLSNPTRASLGIRAWVESTAAREGRRTVTEHRGFTQRPGGEPVPTDIFQFKAQAEAAVNTACALLIDELALAAA